jgi:hypothetical protein
MDQTEKVEKLEMVANAAVLKGGNVDTIVVKEELKNQNHEKQRKNQGKNKQKKSIYSARLAGAQSTMAGGQSTIQGGAQTQSQQQKQYYPNLDSSKEIIASPASSPAPAGVGLPRESGAGGQRQDQELSNPHSHSQPRHHSRGFSHHHHHHPNERHYCCIRTISKDGTTATTITTTADPNPNLNPNAFDAKIPLLIETVPCPYSPPSPLFPISKLKQRFKRILKQKYPDLVPDYIVRTGPVDAVSAAGTLIFIPLSICRCCCHDHPRHKIIISNNSPMLYAIHSKSRSFVEAG